MTMRLRTAVIVMTAGVALAVAGCSSQNTNKTGTAASASKAASDAKGVEGGGDAVLIPYRDPAGKLAFQYPNTWTKTSDQPLTFSGQDQSVSLEVRTVSSSSLVSAAQADEAAIKAQMAGYKPVGIATSKDVKGAVVNSYEWDLAKSAVTGKPVHERSDRYYLDAGGGRVAILTGSAPAAAFDREQVRDIALSVKVMP